MHVSVTNIIWNCFQHSIICPGFFEVILLKGELDQTFRDICMKTMSSVGLGHPVQQNPIWMAVNITGAVLIQLYWGRDIAVCRILKCAHAIK